MSKLIIGNKQILYLICLVALLLVISNLSIKHRNDIYVEIFGTNIQNSNSKVVYVQKNEIYLSLECILQYIDKNIFYDKVSNDIIITRAGQILKMKIGENKARLNYNSIIIENVVVKKGNDIYIPISSINKIYGIDGVIDKEKDIYIITNNSEHASMKNSDVNIYEKANITSRVNGKIKKTDKVNVYYNLIDSDWILVKTLSGQAGYIQKYNFTKSSIDMLYNKKEELKIKINKEAELLKSNKMNSVIYDDSVDINNIYKQNGIDNIFVNMFEVLRISGQIGVTGISQNWIELGKKNDYKVYGIATNGYNSSNFDNTVISTVIRNPETRDTMIVNLSKELEKYNLDGLVIDFESIKKSDEEIYVQFLKELGTSMKRNNKKLLVKNIISSYDIDISKALEYIDYYVIEGYNYRNLDSNISGTDSDINKIIEDIDKVVNIGNGKYKSKIILEIPMYSIMWEEKNSTVINTTMYSQNAVEDFIIKNKLTKKLDTKVNQNYVEMTKGIVTYRMWIEDEYSIKEKIKLAKDKGLAGVSLYRAGYESNNLISKVFK